MAEQDFGTVWKRYNQSTVQIGDTVYRNLEAQVQKNKDDIAEITGGVDLPALVQDVRDLQATVGDEDSGLVKDVDDLQTDVGTKQSWHKTVQITIAVADWVGVQTGYITVNGATATNTIIVAPAPSSYTNYTTAGIRAIEQATESLRFACDKTPEDDVIVNVVILEEEPS